MKRIIIYISFLFSILLICINCTQQNDFPVIKGQYFGQKPPGNQPRIFGADFLSKGGIVASIAFTPDGKEVYFAKNTPALPDLNVILYLKLKDNQWTAPQPAAFSGKYRDWNINLSPDGQRLYYTSRRPLKDGDEPKKDNDIWYVQKTQTGWSEPKNLGPPVNTNKMDCYASVTQDGVLYFHGFDYEDSKGGADIYVSRNVNGKYTTPINPGDSINSKYHDWDVFIAPDESYLIFASVGRPDGIGNGDLYISYRNQDGSWTKARNMGDKINSSADEICPSVSLDGKYLIFTSRRSGRGEVYWVDAQIIEELRPEELK